jgi:hypothetical protein
MATTKKEVKEAVQEVTVQEEVQEEVVQEVVQNEVAVQDTAVAENDDIPDGYDFSDLGFDADELDTLTGLDTINSSDIRVPFGKFWAVTKDGRTAGDIELPDGTIISGGSGGVLEGLCILKPQTVRVYFPQPYKPTNKFICRSLDGSNAAQEEASEYAGRACAGCEFAVYPEGGGSSPCREQVLLLCTLADGTLFHLLVSGIGVGDWKKQFLSVEMMKGLALVKKKLKKGILAALNIKVSIGEKDTDYGKKPVIQFRVDKEQPLVTLDRLKANLDAYSSYKEFEQEAVESAATFAQHEQTEYKEEEATGQNGQMF